MTIIWSERIHYKELFMYKINWKGQRENSVSEARHGWHFGPNDFLQRGLSVNCRMFSSISGLSSLDANSTPRHTSSELWQSEISPDLCWRCSEGALGSWGCRCSLENRKTGFHCFQKRTCSCGGELCGNEALWNRRDPGRSESLFLLQPFSLPLAPPEGRV